MNTFSVDRGSSEAGLALVSGSQSGTEQAWASGYSLGFGGGSKDPFSVKCSVKCRGMQTTELKPLSYFM